MSHKADEKPKWRQFADHGHDRDRRDYWGYLQRHRAVLDSVTEYLVRHKRIDGHQVANIMEYEVSRLIAQASNDLKESGRGVSAFGAPSIAS
jgi:hypothetical protein